MDLECKQKECCDHFGAVFSPVKENQLVAISKSIFEGVNPAEGVRNPSPKHMSGWWLTTEEYDDNIESIITVHFSHIMEKRPELAIYMALPFGYRFFLGGEEENVWLDESVSNQKA